MKQHTAFIGRSQLSNRGIGPSTLLALERLQLLQACCLQPAASAPRELAADDVVHGLLDVALRVPERPHSLQAGSSRCSQATTAQPSWMVAGRALQHTCARVKPIFVTSSMSAAPAPCQHQLCSCALQAGPRAIHNEGFRFTLNQAITQTKLMQTCQPGHACTRGRPHRKACTWGRVEGAVLAPQLALHARRGGPRLPWGHPGRRALAGPRRCSWLLCDVGLQAGLNPRLVVAVRRLQVHQWSALRLAGASEVAALTWHCSAAA